MYLQKTINFRCAILFLVACILLPACDSTPGLTPTPTIDRDELMDELVAMLLDHIVKKIQVRGPEDTYLIVWSPVQGSIESPTGWMDISDPIQVWWFIDGQLTEASDPQAAIEQFSREQMTSEPYGLYDFGILSIREDGKQAEVYSGFDCGGLDCHGQASYESLERDEEGNWEQVGGVWVIE